jgi:hypothetical protein
MGFVGLVVNLLNRPTEGFRKMLANATVIYTQVDFE